MVAGLRQDGDEISARSRKLFQLEPDTIKFIYKCIKTEVTGWSGQLVNLLVCIMVSRRSYCTIRSKNPPENNGQTDPCIDENISSGLFIN